MPLKNLYTSPAGLPASCSAARPGCSLSNPIHRYERVPEAATNSDEEPPPYLAVIIKPTYDCNLACSYCSVYGCDALPRMSRRTVDALIEQVTRFCGKQRSAFLIWHGGEPLLMPLAFYDYIGERTRQYTDQVVINAVQTNATLLSEQYLDVFVKHDFDISISLDGPECLHDASRKGRDGQGTFQAIMQAVALLRGRNLPVGAVAVLTRQNVGRLREVYEFFNREGIHLRINPVQKQGRADTAYADLAITPREYGEAMIQLFDLWYHDDSTRIVVDPFRIIIGNLLTESVDCCDFRRQCHREIISVGPLGEVYPCGQFNGFEDYYFGNIHSDPLDQMMDCAVMRRLLQRVPENVSRCRRCEFAPVCNCGCTVSALINRGNIMDADFYCAGRKMLFAHILETLERDITRAGRLVRAGKAPVSTPQGFVRSRGAPAGATASQASSAGREGRTGGGE